MYISLKDGKLSALTFFIKTLILSKLFSKNQPKHTKTNLTNCHSLCVLNDTGKSQ